MFPSFLLALREGLEAALIIGIVLGVLKKVGKPQFSKAVWVGAGSAALLSFAAALSLNAIGATFEGAAEEIFEGFAMLIAAAVLTWMIFWMQRQARSMQTELAADVRRAALSQSGKALFLLAFMAVLREGIELALFLTAATATTSAQQALIGGVFGLVAAVVLGWLLFTTTVQLNLKAFFQVTGALLILFAAGLVAHGVHEFNEVGWIPGLIEHVWDVNHIINEKGTFGLMLKALFGYNGNPSLTEVLAYGLYFGVIVFGLRRGQEQPLPVPQEV
jgi:high-affinity iron transporter